MPVPVQRRLLVCWFVGCFFLIKTWENGWQTKDVKKAAVIIKNPCKKWIIETLLLSGIHLEVKPMGICRAVCRIFAPWCLLGITC